MKTFGGVNVYIQVFLTRHKLEVSGQLHAPAALRREKSPRYTLDRRLGGTHSRSGRDGEVKILDPTGTRTSNPRSSSP
jgi:hypothetical protein